MTGAPSTRARRAIRTDRERDALIERWTPLVHHVVARLPVALPTTLDREDLVSAGQLGLLHAAARGEPSRGAAFQTFAYTAIRGAVLDEVRRHDPVPRHRRQRLRRMDQAVTELAGELGRAPTVEELGEHLEVPAAQLDEDLLHRETARTLSLDGFADGEDPLAPVAEGVDPADAAAHSERVERLAAAIGDLPEGDRDVIALYHFEGLYLKEIAALLGVTESRICQRLARATARLRQALAPGERD